MKLLGIAIVALAYIALLVCALNAYVDWAEERQRKKMGLACWFYRIGIIRRP